MRISLNVLRNAPTKRAGLTDSHGQSTRRAISPGKRDREGDREGGKITRTKHIPLHDHIRRKAGWQALRMPGYPSISAIVGWLWTRSNTLLSPVLRGWVDEWLAPGDGWAVGGRLRPTGTDAGFAWIVLIDRVAGLTLIVGRWLVAGWMDGVEQKLVTRHSLTHSL